MIDVHETELVVLHKAVILFPQFLYNPLVGSTVQFEMAGFLLLARFVTSTIRSLMKLDDVERMALRTTDRFE